MFESCPSDNGVIQNDKVIDTTPDTSVSDIINMCSQVVALRILGDKSPEFYIFYCNFFGSGLQVEDLLQGFLAKGIL